MKFHVIYCQRRVKINHLKTELIYCHGSFTAVVEKDFFSLAKSITYLSFLVKVLKVSLPNNVGHSV